MIKALKYTLPIVMVLCATLVLAETLGFQTVRGAFNTESKNQINANFNTLTNTPSVTSNETVSGNWTFSGVVDAVTISNVVSLYVGADIGIDSITTNLGVPAAITNVVYVTNGIIVRVVNIGP